MSKSEKCACKETYYVDYCLKNGFVKRYVRLGARETYLYKFFLPSPKLYKYLADLEQLMKFNDLEKGLMFPAKYYTGQEIREEEIKRHLERRFKDNLEDLIILLLRIKITIGEKGQENENWRKQYYANSMPYDNIESPIYNASFIIFYLLEKFPVNVSLIIKKLCSSKNNLEYDLQCVRYFERLLEQQPPKPPKPIEPVVKPLYEWAVTEKPEVSKKSSKWFWKND